MSYFSVFRKLIKDLWCLLHFPIYFPKYQIHFIHTAERNLSFKYTRGETFKFPNTLSQTLQYLLLYLLLKGLELWTHSSNYSQRCTFSLKLLATSLKEIFTVFPKLLPTLLIFIIFQLYKISTSHTPVCCHGAEAIVFYNFITPSFKTKYFVKNTSIWGKSTTSLKCIRLSGYNIKDYMYEVYILCINTPSGILLCHVYILMESISK